MGWLTKHNKHTTEQQQHHIKHSIISRMFNHLKRFENLIKQKGGYYMGGMIVCVCGGKRYRVMLFGFSGIVLWNWTWHNGMILKENQSNCIRIIWACVFILFTLEWYWIRYEKEEKKNGENNFVLVAVKFSDIYVRRMKKKSRVKEKKEQNFATEAST